MKWFQFTVVAAVALAISYYHFAAIHIHSSIHSLHYRLNYFPILLAAVWFGRWGGGVTAVVITAVYLPFLLAGYGHAPDAGTSVYLEFVLYNIIGWGMGELITRRILDQERLAESRRLALLGEMAAGVAHEVRNPAQTIRGVLDILLKRDVSPDMKELLQTAREETERLNCFAGDFLSLSRMVPARRLTTDLKALAVEIESRVRLARGSAMPAVTWVSSEETAEADCDPEQVGQVLRNLLENASSAAGPGGNIVLRIESGRDDLRIVVEDDGPGVPVSDRETVFEPFRTKRSGGTGLGLSIARRIASAHGGVITCGSARTGGASFTLSLPKKGQGGQIP